MTRRVALRSSNYQNGHRAGGGHLRYEAGVRATFEGWDAERCSFLGGERQIVHLPLNKDAPF